MAGAALVAALVVQHQKLREGQIERDRAVEAAAETVPSSAPQPAAPSNAVDPELLRLRGEVARLRAMSNDVVRLTREVNTLRAARVAESSRKAELDEEERKRISIAKMNYMKGWALAAFLHAEKHGGAMPKTFEEIASLIPEDARTEAISPDQAAAHRDRVDELKDRLTQRAEALEGLISDGMPVPLEFDDSKTILLSEWNAAPEGEDAVLDECEHAGVNCYRITREVFGDHGSSWRRRVLLPRGKYRFQARLQLSRSGLRGSRRPGLRRIAGGPSRLSRAESHLPAELCATAVACESPVDLYAAVTASCGG